MHNPKFKFCSSTDGDNSHTTFSRRDHRAWTISRYALQEVGVTRHIICYASRVSLHQVARRLFSLNSRQNRESRREYGIGNQPRDDGRQCLEIELPQDGKPEQMTLNSSANYTSVSSLILERKITLAFFPPDIRNF